MLRGLQTLDAAELGGLGGNPKVVAALEPHRATFYREPIQGSFPIAICIVPADGDCPPEVRTMLGQHFPNGVWGGERTNEGYVFYVRIR